MWPFGSGGGGASTSLLAAAVPAEDGAVPRRPAAAQGLRAALHRHDQGVPQGQPPVRRMPHREGRGSRAAPARSAGDRDHRHARAHHRLGHAAARHPARRHARRDPLQGAQAQRRSRAASSSARSTPLDAEPAYRSRDEYKPLAKLLELIASRVGPQNFPAERAYDDASWVGYRLAELLPLPLHIKQSMLEINERGRAAQGALAVPRAAGPHLTPSSLTPALTRRVNARQPRDEDGEKQRAGDLLHHAHAARRPRERRDVAEAGAREHGHAEIERLGVVELAGLPHHRGTNSDRSTRRSRTQ